uniref:Uncharacterized protein n=1 Tax=Leviviridae sp. TaxID=2027243 RepID=A0A514DAX5_9VIRU|nr:MAG: hypothetical protein H1Rhizo26FD1160_000003 [Leviviridae sp.]
MLADPQSVTVGGSTISIPRVTEVGNYTEYYSADGITSLRITQASSANKRRHSLTLRTAKIAADPISGLNSRKLSNITVTVDRPVDGFTVTEIKDQLVALATLLTASSAATAIKIIQGEK